MDDSSQLTILWDLDGTLCRRIGDVSDAHVEAITQVTGLEPLSVTPGQGMTDTQILIEMLGRIGVPVSREVLSSCLEVLDTIGCAPDRLTAYAEQPFARSTLLELNEQGWTQCLLTGNTQARARAKLRQIGMLELIEWKQLFCDELHDSRYALATAAHASLLIDDLANVVVVGDTPRDIETAQKLGWHVIAVATGAFAATDLQCKGADQVIPDLSSLPALLRNGTGPK